MNISSSADLVLFVEEKRRSHDARYHVRRIGFFRNVVCCLLLFVFYQIFVFRQFQSKFGVTLKSTLETEKRINIRSARRFRQKTSHDSFDDRHLFRAFRRFVTKTFRSTHPNAQTSNDQNCAENIDQ